jgi:prepilin-type N-terminal cleavage/methylation domain-containing protein
MKKNKRAAFTLLELLVVIAIIGILISLGVASFSNAQRKARDSRRREDLKAVQNGLEQYYADHDGAYPVGTGMSTVITSAGSDYFPAGAPDDPKLDQDYWMDADADAYCACALLESAGTGNASNTACAYTTGGDYFCVSNLQ